MDAFTLQFNRLDLGHEPAVVVSQECRLDAEDGVAEAADVQDAASVWARVVLYG